jgi:CRP/FNR family transcriptional regulator, cyclic AMP receptor protein
MPKDRSAAHLLEADAIRCLEGVAVRKRFPKNTVIFSKGDESDSMYVVCRGSVKVVIDDDQGKEIVLSVMGPGECFGEMAAIDGVPRSATVVTQEPAELLMVRRNDLRNLLSTNPAMTFRFLELLLARLREADEKIVTLAFLNVHARVADFLTRFAEPQGEKWIVKAKTTHQEIADTIGCSREMVSRVLKEMLNEGALSMEGNRIVIHRKEG